MPRVPTDEERDQHRGSVNKRRYETALHMKREPYMDMYLREARMWIRANRSSDKEFGRVLGVPSIMMQLRYGNALKTRTRDKLAKLLELV
jgi:hypothetical protein